MFSSELSVNDIQQNSIKILIKIDEVCRNLNLNYFLAYGTLIGAIRHKGFIPWDDDIDIWMPREDYRKLIFYCIEHCSNLEPYTLMSPYNNFLYPHGISRIVDTRYLLDVHNEVKYNLGLFVDIYPLDGVGDTERECNIRKRKASRYSSLCFLSSRRYYERGDTRGGIKQIIKFPAFLYAKVKGTRYFLNALEKISDKKKYEDCKYVGCLVWGTDGVKAIFPKEYFKESIDHEFEGIQLKIPKEYDAILRRLYGDYMRLPPEEKRIGHHHYKAYEK